MQCNIHDLTTDPKWIEAQRLGARNGDPLEVSQGRLDGHLKAAAIGVVLGTIFGAGSVIVGMIAMVNQ